MSVNECNITQPFNSDDGFETASCRQIELSFEIFRYVQEIKNQVSIVNLEHRI